MTDTSIATDINKTEKIVTTEMGTGETSSILETDFTVRTTVSSSAGAEEVEMEDGEDARSEGEAVMVTEKR